MPDFNLLFTIILIAIIMGALQGTCAYLILLERKIAAWVQNRKGPNRVGPWGLFQPLADGLKFLLKEEVIPKHVDRLFYLIAPAIAIFTATLAFAVVPFGPTDPAPTVPEWSKTEEVKQHWPQTVEEERQFLATPQGQDFTNKVEKYRGSTQFVIAPNINVGLVFVFAVGSLAVYAIVLGGWSSNNKYSMLGSLRASAQMISYEIPMGMAILGVVLVTGSLNLEKIIDHQIQHGWNILYQPLAGILFITAVFAECNRLPFDMPEAEQELVGGYHTEYSGMKFALFFLGEYTHMITTSFLVMLVFFGGWHFPGLMGIEGIPGIIVKLLVFAGKMTVFIVFYMLIRWTIPRFRFDQLMSIAWKVLIPLTLANLLGVMIYKHFEAHLSAWWLLPYSAALFWVAGYMALKWPKPEPVARQKTAPREGTAETLTHAG